MSGRKSVAKGEIVCDHLAQIKARVLKDQDRNLCSICGQSCGETVIRWRTDHVHVGQSGR